MERRKRGKEAANPVLLVFAHDRFFVENESGVETTRREGEEEDRLCDRELEAPKTAPITLGLAAFRLAFLGWTRPSHRLSF